MNLAQNPYYEGPEKDTRTPEERKRTKTGIMTEIKKEALDTKVKEEIKPEEEGIIQPLLQELL